MAAFGGFLSLGTDITTVILSYLDIQSLSRLACCSKAYQQAVDSDPSWQRRCVEIGVETKPEKFSSWKDAYKELRGPMVGDAIEVVDLYGQWSAARLVVTVGNQYLLVVLENSSKDIEWVDRLLWLHSYHDRYRMRAITKQIVVEACQNIREFINEDEFENVKQRAQLQLFDNCAYQENVSTWNRPTGPSAGTWPSLYYHEAEMEISDHIFGLGSRTQATVAHIPIPEIDVLLRQQIRRGPFQTYPDILEKLNQGLQPTVPPKLREDGFWVSRVINYSSQYDSTNWAANQTIGPPKVFPRYGDIYGAWAPHASRGADEFLEVEFERSIKIKQISIFETYNPGAVVRVSFKSPSGSWRIVYEGVQTQTLQRPVSRIFSPPLDPVNFETRQIRLDLNTRDSRSWSEIDAIRVTEEESSLDELLAALTLE
eukprot:c4704_g1_i1.p1 GENE.c4704_g1_i1~~c4704_g1_i1.p1  ORF type:complete len:427 (-),score=91.12 c4704_g1_i1:82-1362(-)